MRTRRPLAINNSLAHGICNYSCRLCAVNKPGYCGPKAFQPRAVTERLIARVEEAAAAGIRVRYIANAGDGEPTLHPEFPERMDLFGRMLRGWSAPVTAPEVSVVTNGLRLLAPGVLEALARNRLTLVVSFPTCKPEAYGQAMTGKAECGAELLARVVPGIERAMAMAARGELARLYFHISPPEREFVRRDFPETVEFLASRARAAGLRELELVMFPATSNRSGLLRSRFRGVDTYRDLFRAWDGRELAGVTVHLKLVLKRFFEGLGEIADLMRAFRFPCLWNANLFIAAGGESICCNDQAVRNPLGNVLTHSIAELVIEKETYLPGAVCAGCNQRPERMAGSPAAWAFGLAARTRLALARLAGAGVGERRKELVHGPEGNPVVVESAGGYAFAGRPQPLRDAGDRSLDARRRAPPDRPAASRGSRIMRSRLTEVLRALEEDAQARSAEYRFGAAGDYRIRVAGSAEERARAWGLVYRVYLQKEYAAPNAQRLWYGLHDALPGTTTLLVERGAEPVASLTLVFDSPLGLPADQVYGPELAALRAAGRRPCEVVSLVSTEPELRRGAEVTKHLFKLAYLAARRLSEATDFLITINPRHVSFYRRVLLMEEFGPERPYGKVGGAPAVLLGLDLLEAEERYRVRYGDAPESLYRFFVNPATEPGILAMLRSARRPLREDALQKYFVMDRPLLPGASTEQRAAVHDCYLPHALGSV
jgi:hypothetical protein